MPVLHLATKMGEGGEACGEVRHVLHKDLIFDECFFDGSFWLQVNAARDGAIDFVAGAIGATVSVYVGQPLDTVKV